MIPNCSFRPCFNGSVAVGPWSPVKLPDLSGAMITADANNSGLLLVLIVPNADAVPTGAASADLPNVWTVKPGASIYGRGLADGNLIYVGATEFTPLFQVFSLESAPPGVERYGGDPTTAFGQHLAVAPASWITGTPWTAASSPPLPTLIKSLTVLLAANTSCHLEFDGGGQTDLSISPIGSGRFPFYPGVSISKIYSPAAGQGVTGLVVEY